MAGSFAKQSGLLMINKINIVGIQLETVKYNTFAVIYGKTTVAAKTTMLTFRLDPGLKIALRIAAGWVHRSIINKVEILIRGYCERHGIAIPYSEETKDNNGAHS